MSTKLSLLLLSVAFTGAVYAETAPAPAPVSATPPAAEGTEAHEHGLAAMVKHLDTNKDGILQAAEIDAAKSDKQKDKIKTLDTNKDGIVDAAEIEAGKKAWAEKKEHGEKKDK